MWINVIHVNVYYFYATEVSLGSGYVRWWSLLSWHWALLNPGLRVEMRRELKRGGVCKRISMRIDSKYLLDVSIGTCLGWQWYPRSRHLATGPVSGMEPYISPDVLDFLTWKGACFYWNHLTFLKLDASIMSVQTQPWLNNGVKFMTNLESVNLPILSRDYSDRLPIQSMNPHATRRKQTG